MTKHNKTLQRINNSLRSTNQEFKKLSKRISEQHDLTRPQLMCLLALEEHTELTSGKVAKLIAVSQGTVTGILNRLEEDKGLISRIRCTKDKRRVMVSLNEAGHKVLQTQGSLSSHHGVLRRNFGTFSPNNQRTIVRFLELLAEMTRPDFYPNQALPGLEELLAPENPDLMLIRTSPTWIAEMHEHLSIINQANKKYSRKLSKIYDLTSPQLVCMLTLLQHGEMKSGDLARAASVSQGTVTGILDRLEKRKLLIRQRSTEDKRRVLVSLTEKGADLTRSSPLPLQDIMCANIMRLNYKDQDLLARMMELVENMTTEDMDQVFVDTELKDIVHAPTRRISSVRAAI